MSDTTKDRSDYAAKLREMTERFKDGWKFGAVAVPDVGSSNEWDGDYWRPIPKPPAEQAAGALVESPGTQLWKWIRQFQSRSSDFTFAGVHPEVLRQFLEEHDYDIENLQTQIADKDEEIRRLQPFEQRVAELERENQCLKSWNPGFGRDVNAAFVRGYRHCQELLRSREGGE